MKQSLGPPGPQRVGTIPKGQRSTVGGGRRPRLVVGTSTTATTAVSASAAIGIIYQPFWQSVTITLAFNTVGWFLSMVTASHVHLDLLGTGAFFFSMLPALKFAIHNRRIAYSCGAVGLWSIRLTSFLFHRAMIVKHDGRLTQTLSTTSGTSLFWCLSAIWGIVTALPHSLGTTNVTQSGYTFTNVVGLGLFLLGWAMETISDLQKWSFKQYAAPGTFCDVGLWKFSQHPNFFGNLVLWSGIYILNLPALVVIRGSSTTSSRSSSLSRKDTNLGRRMMVIACQHFLLGSCSPLLLSLLFYGQATGKIGNAMPVAHEKYGYGIDPMYTNYVDQTPLIIPNFSSLFATTTTT